MQYLENHLTMFAWIALGAAVVSLILLVVALGSQSTDSSKNERHFMSALVALTASVLCADVFSIWGVARAIGNEELSLAAPLIPGIIAVFSFGLLCILFYSFARAQAHSGDAVHD